MPRYAQPAGKETESSLCKDLPLDVVFAHAIKGVLEGFLHAQQTESNELIEHLTEQIIRLNQWRETAILEAVEKDRYETSIDIPKNTHRNLYI